MNSNEIVTVVAVNGTEYVGKFDREDAHKVSIIDPHIVTPDGDSLGFMPTVCMTGQPQIKKVAFMKTGILCVVPTAEQVEKEYIKASSGIIL